MPEATLFNNFQIAHFIVKNKVVEYYQNRNANPKCCYKRRDSFPFLWALLRMDFLFQSFQKNEKDNLSFLAQRIGKQIAEINL